MKPIALRRSLFVAAAIAIAALVSAHGVAGQAQVTPDVIAQFIKQYQATPRVTVPVPAGGAAVLIVKFTDFQCPGCGVTYKAYKPVLEKYEAQFPGAIKYVVKDFPLDNSCASWMQQPLHQASCDAAVAVVEARKQNRGDQMEEWFYSNQQLLTKDTVRKAASIVGNVPDFNAGYTEAMNQVKADIGLGRLLDVNSTPTFFVNGAKIAQVLQPEIFDAVIAYELRRAGKMK